MHPEHTELHAWARGWAISRGTPTPVEVPGGYRIDVGLAGHQVRYVLAAFDQALVDSLHHPGTWLKICAEAVRLDPRWRQPPGAARPPAYWSPPRTAAGSTAGSAGRSCRR